MMWRRTNYFKTGAGVYSVLIRMPETGFRICNTDSLSKTGRQSKAAYNTHMSKDRQDGYAEMSLPATP